MAIEAPDVPIIASLFILEIEGLDGGYFSSVSGMEIKTNVVENKYVDTAMQSRVKKTPGAVTTYSDIKLKRGLVASNDMWDWYQELLNGTFTPKSGALHFASDAGEILDTWVLDRAWISAWSSESVEAGSDKLVMEEVTLTVDRIYRESVGASSR